MNPQNFACEKCAGTKNLFIEKRPRAVGWAVFLAALTLSAFVVLPAEAPWRNVVVYLGLVVAFIPLMTLVRIRCFDCEPEWKDKTWG